MKQFYKDVIDFLKSEYNDAYEYRLEVNRSIKRPDEVELKIRICGTMVVLVGTESLQHIRSLYESEIFIEERNQYLWQKELIDLIEGS